MSCGPREAEYFQMYNNTMQLVPNMPKIKFSLLPLYILVPMELYIVECKSSLGLILHSVQASFIGPVYTVPIPFLW